MAFNFVGPADLTIRERSVWDALATFFAASGVRPSQVKNVRVSETMRLIEGGYQEAVGLWGGAEGQIIVKRTQLQSLAKFAGTVIHDASHALSGTPDVTLEFEETLTSELGAIVARQLGGSA